MPVRQILAYRSAIWHLAALATLGGNDLRSSRAPIEQIVARSLATDHHGATIPFVLIDLIMSLMSRFQQPVTSTDPTIRPCRHVPRFWNGPSPFDPVADPLVPSFPRPRGGAAAQQASMGVDGRHPASVAATARSLAQPPIQPRHAAHSERSPVAAGPTMPSPSRSSCPSPSATSGAAVHAPYVGTWVRGESRGSWESRLKA